jgi:hypothetical protein
LKFTFALQKLVKFIQIETVPIGNVNPGGGRYFSYVRERKISETIVSFLTPSDVSHLAKADSDPETIIAMINNGASLKELSFTLDSFKAFAREYGSKIESLNLWGFAIDTEILDLCRS